MKLLMQYTKDRKFITAFDQFVHTLLEILDSDVYSEATKTQKLPFKYYSPITSLTNIYDLILVGMYIDLYTRADPQSTDKKHMVRTLRFLSAVKRTLTMFLTTSQYKKIRTRFLSHLASRNP